ncbi:carbohydrate kinase [Paraflavisolibacter sp. H34]|uniref:carbohydrate kinase family protein n=1 Tax=Huijunlia imazamoxiresistens TaxID=3127457 RepID=UPI00301B54AB
MIQPLSFQVVCFGETLWDILPDSFQPGGAPMNVAYHLNKLGLHPALITRIGTDVLGSRLVGLFQENNISTDYFQVDGKYATGKVYAKPDSQGEVDYEIVYPSAWDCIAWEDRFTPLLQQAHYFVYGSLTSRNPESRQTLHRLLEEATIKVFDTNLRPPYFERSQVEYLMQQADILKMNQSEFDHIAGWFRQYRQPEDQMRFFQDRFQLETVVVSRAGAGALMLHKGGLYRHQGYGVAVQDTIGCGDGFIAGLLHQLCKGAAPAAVLPYANALGALVATYPGACPDYETEEIFSLINSAE